MRQAKAEAAKKGVTLHHYIEDALRQYLGGRSGNGTRQRVRRVKLPVSRAKGGFARGVRDLRHARETAEDSEAARLLNNRK